MERKLNFRRAGAVPGEQAPVETVHVAPNPVAPPAPAEVHAAPGLGPPPAMLPEGYLEPHQRRMPCIITGIEVPPDVHFPALPPPGALPLNLPVSAIDRAQRISDTRFSFFLPGTTTNAELTRIRLQSPGMVHDTDPSSPNRMRMAAFKNAPPENPLFVTGIINRVTVGVLVECNPPPPYGDHVFTATRGSETLTFHARTVAPEFPPSSANPLRVAAVGAGISASDVYAHQVFTVVMGRAEPWMIRQVDAIWVDRGMHRSSHDRKLSVRDLESYDAPALDFTHRGWKRLIVDLEVNYSRAPQAFVLRFHQADGTITAVSFHQPPEWTAWTDANMVEVDEQRRHDRDLMGPGWNR